MGGRGCQSRCCASAKVTEMIKDNLAKQQKMHESGIFACVKRGSLEDVKEEIRRDPDCLELRDAVGATAMHIAFLYEHYSVGKYLVQAHPERVCDQYSRGRYEGENILHIAIVHKRLDIVEWLLDNCPKLLEGEATGAFFRPGSACYFGGYPLLFAVSTNQEPILQAILNTLSKDSSDIPGQNIFLQDKYGNNALHMAVINGVPEMYDRVLVYAVRHFKSSKDPCHSWRQFEHWMNDDKYTPLSLAAHVAQVEVFKHILAGKTQVNWSYGPVTSKVIALIDLEEPQVEMDSKGRTRFTGAKTVVEAVVASSAGYASSRYLTKQGNTPKTQTYRCGLLLFPEVKQILDKKWKLFARRLFLMKLARKMFIQICFIMYCLIPHQFRRDTALPNQNNALAAVVAGFCLIEAVTSICHEGIDIYRRGTKYFTQAHGAVFADNCFIWTWAITFCLGFTFDCVHPAWIMELSFSMASITGWGYLFFFLLGFESTGSFVIMIRRMVLSDMSYWGVVYVFFMIGFSQAFYLLLDIGAKPTPMFGIDRLGERIRALILMAMTGEIKYSDYQGGGLPVASQILIFVYIALSVVLLLNLLIAMMGNTYAEIGSDSYKRWYVERCNLMLELEYGYSISKMQKERAKYSIGLDHRQASTLFPTLSQLGQVASFRTLDARKRSDGKPIRRNFFLSNQTNYAEFSVVDESWMDQPVRVANEASSPLGPTEFPEHPDPHTLESQDDPEGEQEDQIGGTQQQEGDSQAITVNLPLVSNNTHTNHINSVSLILGSNCEAKLGTVAESEHEIRIPAEVVISPGSGEAKLEKVTVRLCSSASSLSERAQKMLAQVCEPNQTQDKEFLLPGPHSPMALQSINSESPECVLPVSLKNHSQSLQEKLRQPPVLSVDSSASSARPSSQPRVASGKSLKPPATSASKTASKQGQGTDKAPSPARKTSKDRVSFELQGPADSGPVEPNHVPVNGHRSSHSSGDSTGPKESRPNPVPRPLVPQTKVVLEPIKQRKSSLKKT